MYKGKIIDAHAHIFPDKIASKAVNSIGNFYGLSMSESGVTIDLKRQMENAGIAHAVVNSSATTPHQVRSINEFIFSQIKDTPQFTGLMSLHPDLSVAEIDFEIKFAKDNNFKGVKLHPDFQAFDIDDERAMNIYSACEGVLPILFHTGDKRYSYSKPQKLARVLKRFPKLKAQAAHFGGYSRWSELDCYLDVLENVWFDTSSTLFIMPKDEARGLIEKFGVDKFMFGTDYPMWNPAEELERFLALELGDDANQKILCDIAAEFYTIK